MNFSKTALDAETDQMIAYIAESRSDPDAAPPAVTGIAGGIAAKLEAQFPGDPALGRIVVAVSQTASALVTKSEWAGLTPGNALAVVINAIAFAGQELAQRPGDGS